MTWTNSSVCCNTVSWSGKRETTCCRHTCWSICPLMYPNRIMSLRRHTNTFRVRRLRIWAAYENTLQQNVYTRYRFNSCVQVWLCAYRILNDLLNRLVLYDSLLITIATTTFPVDYDSDDDRAPDYDTYGESSIEARHVLAMYATVYKFEEHSW